MSTQKFTRGQSWAEFLLYWLGALLLVALSLIVGCAVLFVCAFLSGRFDLPSVFTIISMIVAGLIALLMMSFLVSLERRREYIARASSAIVRRFSHYDKDNG